MKNELLIKALTKFLLGVAILCAAIFGAAGSLGYWNGWVLMAALFITMPMIIGSPIATAIMLLYIPLIVRRIHLEEKLLERELKGYSDYKHKVRYRLFPYIW